MDRLRDELWSVMEPTYNQILRHPFVAGLTDGSLPTASFAYYIGQDARYLVDYARALATVAAKAPDAATVAMFAADSRVAIDVESQLHGGLAAELAERHPAELAAPVSPTTLAYTSYLLRVCSQGDFAEGLAAVLPCYWIYAEVGATLLARSSPEPLYARWIETYGGDEFAAATAAVLDAVDAVGDRAGDGQRAAMRDHVGMTTRYEWMFWDAGWRRETWPI